MMCCDGAESTARALTPSDGVAAYLPSSCYWLASAWVWALESRVHWSWHDPLTLANTILANTMRALDPMMAVHVHRASIKHARVHRG